MRIYLIALVLLLIPTLLYFSFVGWSRERLDATGQPVKAPWSWLAIAGGLLVIVSFLAYSLSGLDSDQGEYRPARIIDGKIEEGYFDDPAN